MKLKGKITGFILGAALECVALGDDILLEVAVETEFGGTVERISESDCIAGGVVQVSAPKIEGAVFTHWSISTDQAFESRDIFGRAFDVVSAKVYESTILRAHYVGGDIDADHDGLADGDELYWYGNLAQGPGGDTDGDGRTFAEELAAGTNPHLVETQADGCVLRAMTPACIYNPHAYRPYVIRSSPEGSLFETQTVYLEPGSNVETRALSPLTTSFAYWTVNGAARRDALGRAVDSVAFVTGEDVVLEAVCAEDAELRAKLYWYGRDDIAMDSDTDGDGRTFAEELAEGTNPLLAEEVRPGSVLKAATAKVLYNPHGYAPYVIRCEPEGRIFETITDYAEPGARVDSPACSPDVGGFGFWTLNGAVQRDVLGRALDKVALIVTEQGGEAVAVCSEDVKGAKLYWYGRDDIAMDSDTDGDGRTFAEELAEGTNPLLAEEVRPGGVIRDKGETKKINLQFFELQNGFVVNGGLVVPDFDGRATWPVVTDVNGDGLWDVVVCQKGGVRVLVNVGTKGNPEFEERIVDVSGADLAMNSTDKLDTLDLDTPVIGALSATVWGDALLASDTEGRIWYYKGTAVTTPVAEDGDGTVSYQLQHKVWGGSYAGFAQGLRLAAVDWEDDGDLDCLCGTADGKLMLLRDPKVGRPTNLKALAGVDNVLLTWDPNAQSRVRGYKVYRSEAEDGAAGLRALPTLPTYRDEGLNDGGEYWYRVSSLSRFYKAGNSTPTIAESPVSEPVCAVLGRAGLHWTDASAWRGETFSLMLSVDNSMNLSPEGMAIEIEYDHAVLNLLKRVESGLFEQDKIAPGGGKLYEYVFEVLGEGAGETTVSVKSATMYALGGARVTVALPEKDATITIAAGSSTPPYRLGDVTGDGIVDKDDLRELAKLKSAAGRKWTANQLKAGDINGNGKLDEADYQALRDLLKEKGLL